MTTAMEQLKNMNAQAVADAEDQFVLDLPQGVTIVPADRNYGLCENGMDRNGAEWVRFASTAMDLTLAAPGAPLILAAGTSLNAFDTGDTETGDNIAWPQNIVETDGGTDGAPVRRGFQFLVRAVSFEVMDPYVSTGTTPTTFTKNIDPWIDGYKERIRRAVMQNFAAQVTFPQGACSWIIGRIEQFPPNAGIRGSDSSDGAGIGLGNLMPLRRPILAGAQDDEDQLTMNLVGPNAIISFGSDVANPTVAALQVQIVTTLYGQKVKQCDTDCILRAFNTLTKNQMAMLAASTPG
jgi:hypothetical protein